MNPIEKVTEDLTDKISLKYEQQFKFYIKPKKWWMPKFIYNAVIRNHVDLVVKKPKITKK